MTKEVVRVWKDGKHVETEVKEYKDDLFFPEVKVVWDEKKGGKAPSNEEALALFDALEDGIN